MFVNQNKSGKTEACNTKRYLFIVIVAIVATKVFCYLPYREESMVS